MKYRCMTYLRDCMKRWGLLGVLVFLLVSCGSRAEKRSVVLSEKIDTVPMLVMQIQKCSRMYSAECQLHKIITHDDVKKLSGTFMQQEFSIDLPIGKRKIAIPIDGTVKAYIDFSEFSAHNVRRKGGKIELVLPDPKITLTSTRINHKEIKQYVALLRSNFSDEELAAFEKQGREAMIHDIPTTGLLEMARESAARMLIPMVEQLGYKREDISVTFRRNYSLEDIQRMMVLPSQGGEVLKN